MLFSLRYIILESIIILWRYICFKTVILSYYHESQLSCFCYILVNTVSNITKWPLFQSTKNVPVKSL